MLIPASPDCGTPEPDSAASAALESFAGLPRRDDILARISGGQPMHDVPPGREEVIAIVDMFEHVTDVTLAQLTLGLLR